jgi:hypothetical protein
MLTIADLSNPEVAGLLPFGSVDLGVVCTKCSSCGSLVAVAFLVEVDGLIEGGFVLADVGTPVDIGHRGEVTWEPHTCRQAEA